MIVSKYFRAVQNSLLEDIYQYCLFVYTNMSLRGGVTKS